MVYGRRYASTDARVAQRPGRGGLPLVRMMTEKRGG
jgi:hypothetical protein